MSNIKRLQNPTLINPYSGWDNLANTLYKTSTNYLNRLDTQKQNDIDNAYREKTFDNTVKNQDIKNGLAQKYFDWKNNKDLRDFTYQKGRDETKDNQFERTFEFNSNKPKYTTFTGVDTDGNPVLNVFNQNDGTVTQTNSQVYKTPKEMTPYQEEAIRLRDEAAKEKKKLAQIKAIETLSATDNWDNLSNENQQKMIEYYNKTGLIPKIDNPFFGEATPIIPLSKQEKLIKQKQLEEDFKTLGL